MSIVIEDDDDVAIAQAMQEEEDFFGSQQLAVGPCWLVWRHSAEVAQTATATVSPSY